MVIWRVKDRLRFPLRHSDLWAWSSQWLKVCPWSGRLVLRALSSWSQTHVSWTWPKDKKWDTKNSLEQDVRLGIINEGVQVGPPFPPPILEVTRTLTLAAVSCWVQMGQEPFRKPPCTHYYSQWMSLWLPWWAKYKSIHTLKTLLQMGSLTWTSEKILGLGWWLCWDWWSGQRLSPLCCY